MKRTLLIAICVAGFFPVKAQPVADQVDLGAGYPNEVFYSLEGVKTPYAANSWDVAFCTTLMDAGVRSNDNTVIVYKISNADSSDYASITDTSGLTLTAQYNSDTGWFKGAFNINANPSNPFDFGWGIYDFGTHNVYGDTLYLIKKGSSFYKFWIRQKSEFGSYLVRYANITTGSADIDITIPGLSYQAKNFVYLNLDNPVVLDFEPATSDWQLLFTRYVTILPYVGPYLVTGVLSNIGLMVAEADNVDLSSVNAGDYIDQLQTNISEIGYDWKTFDLSSMQYHIKDSLIYFISANEGASITHSLRFTGFNDTTGVVSFEINDLLLGINETEGDILQTSIFPNPVNNLATIVYEAKRATEVKANLFDVTGKSVMTTVFTAAAGLNTKNIKLPHLSGGIYHLSLVAGQQRISLKLVVAQ